MKLNNFDNQIQYNRTIKKYLFIIYWKNFKTSKKYWKNITYVLQFKLIIYMKRASNMDKLNLGKLTTESRNQNTLDIDQL